MKMNRQVLYLEKVLIWKKKETERKRKEKTERLTLPDFKVYCNSIAIKTVLYQCNGGDRNLLNTIKRKEVNPYIYKQFFIEKPEQFSEQRTVFFPHKWYRNDCACMRRDAWAPT